MRTPEHLMEQQATLLRTFAQRLVEGPKRLLDQQEALLSAIKSRAFQGDDLETAFRLLTETTARLMRIERVSIWRYTVGRNAIRCIDLYELSQDRHSAGIELQAALFPNYFEALATSEAIVADDARTDLRTREFLPSYLAPLGITSMMDIPLILYGHLEGVLCHEQVGTPVSWLPEDRLFGMAIANLIVLAIERSERKRAEEKRRADEAQRRIAIEERLRQSEERYRSLVENLKVVVFQTDAEGRWQFLNPAWTELTGFSVAESLAKRALDFVHPEDRESCLGLFRSLMERQQDCRTEMRFSTRNGESRWVEGFARPTIDSAGVVEGTLGTLTDVTDRKAADARVQHLAYHDPLTNLPNRTLVMDRLERSLAEAKRHNRQVAILFLDLDNFKIFNDTFGHDAGDQLLAQVSARLANSVREEDTVARVGGDEFLLVLADARTAHNAALVADKTLQALALPFYVQGRALNLTLSIGISIYPEDGVDRESLLKQADIALYKAKESGRNTYRFFNPELHRPAIDEARR
jgi:diguanylate cyclase (GGDEF)-like protein/PAS domain S-box-containing protein